MRSHTTSTQTEASSTTSGCDSDPAAVDVTTTPGAAMPDLRSLPAAGSAEEATKIARLFEMTSDLLATISADGRFRLLNPAWEQVLGWSRDEMLSQPVADLMHPNDIERTLTPMLASSQVPTQIESFTNRFRHRDGSWRWLLWSARCDDEIWYASAKDVTDRMWLERQALHDPLTKLPNRLLLMDRTLQAVARLHRSDSVVSLLFIDLDRFKAVNDNLGHEVGDSLLIGVSERLGELMRDSDTVARLGGDEFVILAEDLVDEAEALSLADRVLAALEQPFSLGKADVSVVASVGVSVCRDSEADPEALLHEADTAMYQAKAAGGRRAELFDDGLRRELKAHMAIENRLRDALPQDELRLDYQPILPLAGGRAVGCEALVRWEPDGADRSKLSRLLPSVFLPRAEESELIVQIGDWVLRAVCEQAAEWSRQGISIPISINVSPRELTEIGFADRVREQLSAFRLPGRAICLEVSEQALLRDPERVEASLRELKRLDVTIALDNFGAGQSPFSLPKNLPLDMLKLDRSLIQGFESDRDRRAIVAGMIALAHEAGLTAVAVGIENRQQLALALELDCAVGQGFLLQKPDSPDKLRLNDAPVAVTSAPWRPGRATRGQRPSPLTGAAAVEAQKQAAATDAALLVDEGMRLGLGTGSTVAHLLPALAARRLGGLRCVATSPATAAAARALGLIVDDPDEVGALDLAIDGADQIDPSGWLIKGGGGAHTREKIVAASARRFVVIASAAKAVSALGPPVPLELLAYGAANTLAELAPARLRDAPPSPDGGLIADYLGAFEDPRALAVQLSGAPGVIEHGLFAPEMVSEILIASEQGVEHRSGAKPER